MFLSLRASSSKTSQALSPGQDSNKETAAAMGQVEISGQWQAGPYETPPHHTWVEEGGQGLVDLGCGKLRVKETVLSFLFWPLPRFQLVGWLCPVGSEVALQEKAL